MTGTDTFGGTCPNCGYRKMILRYGSEGIFHCDACPRCGFAYGCNMMDPAVEGKEFWKDTPMFKMFKVSSREELFKVTETWSEEGRDENNVFQYSEEDVKRIMHTFKAPFIFR